eukprot:400244_1
MASRKVRRLKIDPLVKDKLLTNGFVDAKDVLTKTDVELIRSLDMYLPDLNVLFKTISSAVTPRSDTALELFQTRSQCSICLLEGVEVLRASPKSLVEIVGPAGVGKTQSCLTLAVQASRIPASVEGGCSRVIYIDTEGTFNASRFVEMARARYPETFASLPSDQIADKVFVFRENSTQSLINRLNSLDEVITQKNAKLLVIDSLAHPLRTDFPSGQLARRSAKLAEIASKLKYLAKTFCIPIVITNQVTGKMGDNAGLIAALGVTWAHAVNTRFILEERGSYKQIKIAKSPEHAFESFQFEITTAGFRQLSIGDSICYDEILSPGRYRCGWFYTTFYW